MCHNALSDDGMLTAQTESPWVESYHPSMKKVFHAIDDLFPVSKMYLSFIPLYPAGMWSMACASKSDHPLSDDVYGRITDGIESVKPLKYYNADLHRGSFALPNFVSDLIAR